MARVSTKSMHRRNTQAKFSSSCFGRFASAAIEEVTGLKMYEIMDAEYDQLSMSQKARWEVATQDERQGLWWAIEQFLDYDRTGQQQQQQQQQHHHHHHHHHRHRHRHHRHQLRLREHINLRLLMADTTESLASTNRGALGQAVSLMIRLDGKGLCRFVHSDVATGGSGENEIDEATKVTRYATSLNPKAGLGLQR